MTAEVTAPRKASTRKQREARASSRSKPAKKNAKQTARAAPPRAARAVPSKPARKAPVKAAQIGRTAKTGRPAEATKPPIEERRRAQAINRRLAKAFPDARCTLDYRSPLELLVATILSAQCTDERVNKVTPALFRRFPTSRHYAEAEPAELEESIRSTGFFRNKAKSIRAAGQVLVEKHQGQVPRTMEELLTLPGVARKTANVVLGNAFGEASGVVVDTHVHRVTRRLGLTQHEDPNKIERDLMALLPRHEWVLFSHRVIQHGRRICIARKPRCPDCPLADLCPSAQL